MPKLIYVWNYREWGGAQIYFLSLIREALRVQSEGTVIPDFDVSVVVPEDSEARVLDYLAELGVTIEFCDPAPPAVAPERGVFRKLRHRVKVFASEKRLASRVLDVCGRGACGPVIVHVDLGFWQSYRALSRLCRRATVFVTQHTALVDPGGVRGALWRWKAKRMSRLPNFVILASNNDAKRSLRPFVSAEKFDSIRVTYTGIDPEEITGVGNDRAMYAERRRSSRAPLVMTVGQFIERKGCWVVLDALEELRDAGENVDFAWLGTSELDAKTIERIDRYHLGDRFRFMSAEDIGPARADMLGLLSSADIFVLASFREGLPIALVEAMALGLPCVASRVGAIPEAIDHDVSGLLLTPGNATELAGAIRSLIHDDKIRSLFGAAAKAVALEKFNLRTTAEQTVELYRRCSRS